MILCVSSIVSDLNTRARIQIAKLEVMHVRNELRRIGILFAEDPRTAAVVLQDALDMFFKGYVWKDTMDELGRLEDVAPAAEQVFFATSGVKRAMKSLYKNPKKVGVVLREVLSGALAVENWLIELQRANYFHDEKMINGVMHEMYVKIGDIVQGFAQALLLTLSSFENPDTATERMTEALEVLADHREELTDDAAKVLQVLLGDDPESMILFWKDLLRGMIGNDTKPGSGLVWEIVRGRRQGQGPIRGMTGKGEARRMKLGLESTSTLHKTEQKRLKAQAEQDRALLARKDTVVKAEARLERKADGRRAGRAVRSE